MSIIKRAFKITIIEMEYHADNIYYLAQMFISLKEKYDVSIKILSTQKVFDTFGISKDDLKGVEWILLANGKNKRKFIAENRSIINTSDLLFINTFLKTEIYWLYVVLCG